MLQPFRSFVNWLEKPEFESQDKNLSAFYIQALACVIIAVNIVLGVVYSVAGQITYVVFLAATVVVETVVIALIRNRKLNSASNLFLVAALFLLMLGVLFGGGIHATSSVLYPIILIFASLLLDRKSYILYGMLCLISIGVIIYAENQNLTPVYVPDEPELPLFLTFSLIVISVAVVIRFITENWQDNLNRSRLYAQKLAEQKAMLDHVGQAVVGCQFDNTIMYWNQAATDLYGWKPEEVIGRKYYSIIPNNLTPEMLKEIQGVLQRGEAWSGEMEIRKRDQSAVPVIVSLTALRGESGAFTGWVGVAADLSERVELEQVNERRAEEMGLLYRLSVSLASGKDLFDTLLALQTEIIKLIPVDAFFVAIYDKDTDIVSYPISFDEGKPMVEHARRLHDWPGLTGAVIFNNQTLYLPDMDDPHVEELYHPLDDRELHLHTFLGIPLNADGQTLGMLSVQSMAVDAYTPSQIQLMENVALQAAIAIDKANLLDQIKQELTERRRAEAQTRERETVLESITFAAEQFLKSADWRANMNMVLERFGKTLNVTHAYLFEDHLNAQGELVTSMRYEWTAPGYPSDLDSPYFQSAAISKEGFEEQVEALMRGEVRVGNLSTFNPIEKENMSELGVKSILEVPITVNEKIWGAIGFDDFEQEREWSNAEVDALKIAAGILSAAIQREKAESAVRESERIYRQAIEVAGAVPYYQDYQFDRFQFMGQGIEKIMGYTPEEMSSTLWTSLIHDQVLLGELAGLEASEAVRLVRTGQVKHWRCDNQVRAKDGQLRWIADSAIELLDGTGNSYGSIGIMQDITERKQIEINLRQREAMLEAITFAAEQFLKSADWRVNIERVLERLGQTFHASHAYLFEHYVDTDEIEYSVLKYEWTAPGQAPDFDNPYFQKPNPINTDAESTDFLLRRGEVLLGNVAEFSAKEKEQLLALGVKAIVEVPLFVDGKWWGTFGLDDLENERDWNNAEVDALKVAAGILSAAVERQKVEAAVHESERIYRQAIEAAGAVPYYRDYRQNRYTFMGSQIEKILGYKPEEITVSIWREIMKENIPLGSGHGLPVDDAVAFARAGKFHVWRSDMRVIAKNGQERWLTDSAVELFDGTELSYASVGILQDVTDRKLTEASLRKREAILEAITFSAEQFLKTSDWRARINVVLERLGQEFDASHAYLFEKHAGSDGTLLNSLRYEWVAPGEKSDLNNPEYQNAPVHEIDFRKYYMILDSGEPFVGGTSYFLESEPERQWMISTGIKALLEIRIVVNGKQWGTIGFDDVRHEREWTSVEVDVIKIAANVLGAAIKRQMDEAALQKELEERRRTEQALRLSEEKFSKAFHTTQVFMTIEDSGNKFIDANNAFVTGFGFERAEVIGNSASGLNIFYDRADAQRVQQIFQDKGFLKDFEVRFLRRSGEVGSILLSSERFFVDGTAYTLTSGLDITERKRAEAERERLIADLESKNGELERFTYTVSHDLKSPLVTINGFLGYLEKDAAAGNLERLKKDTQRIQEAVNKMQRLLNELLELSRIGRMMNVAETVPFVELVHEAMEIVQGRLMERMVGVHVQPNLPAVVVDRPRLVEVLQNLLDNAAKYMGAQPDPVIEVGQRGAEADGQLIFYVKDNGMGVAPEYHERIFGLFNKLDPRSEGTGVGLALVKRIIEVHGGRIWIESELGQGATFLFTLPSQPKPDSVI